MTGEARIETEEVSTRYLWLIKTGYLGDTTWIKKYGTGLESDFYRGFCVREAIDSCYIISGQTGGYGLWLVKVDTLGDTIWTQNYGEGMGRSVLKTMDSGYVIVGTNTAAFLHQISPGGDLWIIKTDSIGDTVWSRLYGGLKDDVGECVQQTKDKGFIISGQSNSFISGWLPDVYLLRVDSLGSLSVKEEPIPITSSNWTVNPCIGKKMVLRFSDCPSGLKASVLNALGQVVVEINTSETSGVICWGGGHEPGVYFIQVLDNSNRINTVKFVLIR
jgi:hypothetical protein